MAASVQSRERISDKTVLLVISGGLILILVLIVAGLLYGKTAKDLPNWAENVLVSIATATALKLGDALATLVALSTGRQVERLGTQLANAVPVDNPSGPVPQTAAEGADQAAESAAEKADELHRRSE